MKLRPGLKVRVKINDVIDRFRQGETGTTVPNDFAEKYDAFVLLPSLPSRPSQVRQYYFYADELEVIEPNNA